MTDVKQTGAERLTPEELHRALEVAKNTGGWSFEETELMARVVLEIAGPYFGSSEYWDEQIMGMKC